jgi:hypothetical protein
MSAPYGRRGLALLLVIAAALAGATATPAADKAEAKQVNIFGLGQGAGHVRSRVVTHGSRRLAAFPASAWGGTYTASSGARVTVFTSSAYPVDQAVNQATAEFVDQLVHGKEISTVKVYFAPPAEVGILCHTHEADGCYFPARSEIVTVGEDTPWSTVEEVLTHEYGHHVAANRDNSPWPAIAYGAKRWATYAGVCQKEAAGAAFPGDEGEHYLQNPGEAFAESFLHLNEVKLGMPVTPWGYDPVFTPDSGALAAIEKDVVQPWTEHTLKRWSGRFTRRGQARTLRVPVPLDGVFAAQLKGPRGSTLQLTAVAQIDRVSSRLSAALICGERSVTVRFVAGGRGRYAAMAAIP